MVQILRTYNSWEKTCISIQRDGVSRCATNVVVTPQRYKNNPASDIPYSSPLPLVRYHQNMSMITVHESFQKHIKLLVHDKTSGLAAATRDHDALY